MTTTPSTAPSGTCRATADSARPWWSTTRSAAGLNTERGANLRKLYGTYTFGGGSELLLGQNYTPLGSYFYSNSVFDGDGDLLGVGQFYNGRQPMVQWKTGGLKLAAITPNTPADVDRRCLPPT